MEFSLHELFGSDHPTETQFVLHLTFQHRAPLTVLVFLGSCSDPEIIQSLWQRLISETLLVIHFHCVK